MRNYFSVKQTVACCKNVLKDYWQSLRIDLSEESEVWIEEAKRKRLGKKNLIVKINVYF